jgi:fibronectin type 3 domain-containing protein
VGYILDSNRYVVLFESTSDAATTGGIYGQLILNDGALWQPRFVVQDLPTYYETAPCVCRGSLSEYEFLACWKGPPDGGTDSETWVVMLDISPPPIPTGLGATPGDQQVALNWTAVGGGAQLAGYNVYYQVTGAGTWTQANGAVVTGTTYTVASLTNGTNYTFAVSSLDTHENESAKSATVAATPVDGVAPAAPTGLAATTSSATVHLTGYDVYRSLTEGGVYTKVNAALVLTPAYSDGGRTNGVTYWYYVVAKDTSGNASLASARISAVPAYSIPAGLTLDSNGIASVSMHWSAVSEPDLAGYLVYRGTASGGPYTQITPSPLAGTSFIDTGLAAGTYYYVVTAKSTGAEESAWSNQIVGTPTEVPAPDLDAANERKTNDQTPLLTGTSVAGFIVRIYEGATLLGEGTAGAGGAFSVASTVVLAEGVHTIHATATTPGAGGITSGASAGVDVAIDLTPPAPPANVRVVAGNAWAEVSWDPNTEADIHGYNVYRRTGGGAWTKLNANPLVNSRYLDRPVTNGTAYEYKVTAVDDTLDED